MNKSDQDFLFNLLSTPSPTGFETRGQGVWMKEIKKYANAVESDAYGTAWATLNGTGKHGNTNTVMLEAHADEIGFITKYITKEGFIHVDRIGGVDAAVARGRRITILTEKGEVTGIIGNTAIHIRPREKDEAAPKIHELYVDVGAKSDKEVEKMGIRVGQPAVYSDEPMMLSKETIVSRAIDNRIGGFVIAEVFKRLKKKKPECTVYGVNSVQEEIGGYGAKMVAHRLKPCIAIVLDVCHATDTPGIDKTKHGHTVFAGGPSVTHGSANHPEVVKRICDIAKKKKITVQHEASGYYSGTDTDSIYHVQEGIPSALISIPLRYMHSAVETINTKDVDATIDLVTEVISSIKRSDSFGVKV